MEVYQSKAIKSACKRLAGSDWNDLLHDVIIKLSTKDLQAIHERGHILAYAMRVTMTCMADRHRKAQHLTELHETTEVPDEIDPYSLRDYESIIEQFEQGSRRNKILAETVKLVIKHGSVKEVSRLTDVPDRTIRHYINEFREKANDISNF